MENIKRDLKTVPVRPFFYKILNYKEKIEAPEVNLELNIKRCTAEEVYKSHCDD